MASIINAISAGPGGLSFQGDASGNLILQGTGNTAITINSSGIPTLSSPIISGIMTGIGSQSTISYLGVSTNLVSANTWYDGPNTGAIGDVGQKWLITCSGLINYSGSQVYGEIGLWNATASSWVAFSGTVGAAAGWPAIGVISWIGTLSGPTTFILRGAANVAGSQLLSNTIVYGNPGCTYIATIRLA